MPKAKRKKDPPGSVNMQLAQPVPTSIKPNSVVYQGSSDKAEYPAFRDSVFQSECREDIAYWIKTDAKVARKVFELIEAVMRDPFSGKGHPEALKYIGPDVWSRRIGIRGTEHRLVYLVSHDRVDFLAARYHYSKLETSLKRFVS